MNSSPIAKSSSTGGKADAPFLKTRRRCSAAIGGFSNDPLALTKSYLLDDGQTLYVEAEAGQVGVTIEQTPSLFDTIAGTRLYSIIADNARPELIDHMCSKGYRVEPAMKGAGSVKEGVAWIQARNVVINPACRNTVREFELYSWKVDRDGTILPDLEDEEKPLDRTRCATAQSPSVSRARRSGP